MATADISIFVQIGEGIATVALPVIGAWVGRAAIKYLNVSSDSATAERITAGVDALSDLALNAMHGAATRGEVITVSNSVAGVLDQASDGLKAACARQGTTPEQLAARVTAQLVSKASQVPAIAATRAAVGGVG